MRSRRFWKPYPSQVITAGLMLVVVVMFLIYSIVDNSITAGVLAIFFGALGIWELSKAYRHVRLRREQWEMYGNHDAG